MRIDSLSELKAAFVGWRRGKRHVREGVPDELLERARRAAEVHGVKDVVRVIRVERSRLFPGRRDEGAPAIAAPIPPVPAFSRLELTPSASGAPPIAELETPAGIKLRVFAESKAMVGLLSSLCGLGGAR